MTLKSDAEKIKKNILKIQGICQETPQENDNNSEILRLLNEKNEKIDDIVQENKSIISEHEKEYMNPLNELKIISDSISDD